MKKQARLPAKKLLVKQTKQLKALASPVRQTILDAMMAIRKPTTIKEIAARIGRTPHALYHHFRSLAQVGLIFESGTIHDGSKPSKSFVPAAWQIRIKYDFDIPGFRTTMLEIAAAATRLALRDFEQSLDNSHTRCETLSRNLYVGRGEARLTKEELQRINECVNEIRSIMTSTAARSSGERCSVLVAMSPLDS